MTGSGSDRPAAAHGPARWWLAALVAAWIGAYPILRLSGVVVRTNLDVRDAGGVVVDNHAWVQVGSENRSFASWVTAVVFLPLWQLEFRLRGVYYG